MPKTPRDLVALLSRYRFNFTNEREMQDGIELILTACNEPYEREFILSAEDRPDFFVGGVCIECKVGGSLSDLSRQIERYTRDQRVTGILVVTNRVRHNSVSQTINGKPVLVHSVVMGGL